MPDDLLEDWIVAHARAWDARRDAQRARWRMKGALVLGTLSIAGTIVGEHFAIQAATNPGGAPLSLGPYVIPIFGVIATYASFRTAFSEHRRRTEADIVSVKSELDKKVAHEVLDVHLQAIRSDIGGLKDGMEGVRDSLTHLAVSIGKLQGNGGGA